MAEGQRLQRDRPHGPDPVKLRRAIVVLISAQGQACQTSRTRWTAGWQDPVLGLSNFTGWPRPCTWPAPCEN
jgi:hypothetical protein